MIASRRGKPSGELVDAGPEVRSAEAGGRVQNIRVLIADDDPDLRSALGDLIGSDELLELVGAAKDAEEAAELAGAQRPDVALVDVRMPGGGGPTATREILSISPQTRVLALSAYEDRKTVLEMLGAGAVGYLVKGTPPGEIILAVTRAARGQSHLSAEVMGSVVHELSAQLRQDEVASEERRAEKERLQRILRGEGLRMVFQPIVDLGSRAVVGLEALSRFNLPPERTPDLWFQEAWTHGFGVELELAAVELALDETDRMPPEAYLSVNLSHRAAMSPRLLETLPFDGRRRIVLEVTEHDAVEDYNALVEALRPVRQRGAWLAIDDAGAGFASLRHTLKLAPEIIKLDISLTRDIDDLEQGRGQRALASALISFAEEMDMTIVAEGIETQAELDTLLDLEVHYGQGYFLARPGPLE